VIAEVYKTVIVLDLLFLRLRLVFYAMNRKTNNVNRKRHSKMFLTYLLQNQTDSDKI